MNSSTVQSIQSQFIAEINQRGFSFEIQRDLYAAWPAILGYLFLILLFYIFFFFFSNLSKYN